MDEKQKELTEEQREYLASFKSAMEAIDEKVKADAKKTNKYPKAYAQLVREGYWSPDIIAFEFALCTRKLCALPARLREYVLQVGALAEQIHTKSQELKSQKKDENHD